MTLLLGKYETHPAADLFPLMDEEALARLAEDIKKHGLREPVVMHDGKVLDGRNRLLACDKARTRVRLEPWTGTGSPLEWVLSQNLHRRHLTESQRAMVAAASLPMLKAEAKEREHARKTGTPANLQESSKGESTAKAATIANVSPRSVAHAAKVIEHAVPELQEAVRTGDVAVSAAAALADEPDERQRALVAEGPRAVRQAAKEKRKPELTPVERFVLRARIIAEDTSVKSAEQVRADLQAALEQMDAA